MKSIIQKNISNKQASDSGMALVLILLIIGYFSDNLLFYYIAIPALVVNMIYPRFYHYFAILWFTFSNILGQIMSKIILTIIYILLVIPIGLIRQLAGIDNLKLSKFKKRKDSVFTNRDHSFTSKDIENPY